MRETALLLLLEGSNTGTSSHLHSHNMSSKTGWKCWVPPFLIFRKNAHKNRVIFKNVYISYENHLESVLKLFSLLSLSLTQ